MHLSSLLYMGKGPGMVQKHIKQQKKKYALQKIQSPSPICLTQCCEIIIINDSSHIQVPSPFVIDMPCLFALEKLMCQAIATLRGLAECNLTLCYFHPVNKVDDHAVEEI